MSIYDEIREALLQEWRSGVTQQQIVDRANVTNPYINNLLSGKRRVESMKLETLFKLFPQAAICLGDPRLSGDGAFQGAGGVSFGIDAGIVTKILEDETLTDEEKVKVLKVLRK